MSVRSLGRAGVPLLSVLLAAACQAPQGSFTSQQTPSVAPQAAAECPNLELRTPQGARLDLTGTWTSGTEQAGDQIRYDLRQRGECLWGRGYSAYQGQEPGESFDMVLVGVVRTDFTAQVDLLELHVAGDVHFYPSFDRASLTLEIQFQGAGAGDAAAALVISSIRARAMTGTEIGLRLFPTGGPIVGQVLTRSP